MTRIGGDGDGGYLLPDNPDDVRIEVSRVFGVTFIRNNLVERFGNMSEVRLPNPLGSRNAPVNPDIVMPAIWWKDDGD